MPPGIEHDKGSDIAGEAEGVAVRSAFAQAVAQVAPLHLPLLPFLCGDAADFLEEIRLLRVVEFREQTRQHLGRHLYCGFRFEGDRVHVRSDELSEKPELILGGLDALAGDVEILLLNLYSDK